MIDTNKVKRRVRPAVKQINIKLPVSALAFVKQHDYSPTAILMEALRELGWTDKAAEQKPDAFVNVYTAKGDVSTEHNNHQRKHTRRPRR